MMRSFVDKVSVSVTCVRRNAVSALSIVTIIQRRIVSAVVNAGSPGLTHIASKSVLVHAATQEILMTTEIQFLLLMTIRYVILLQDALASLDAWRLIILTPVCSLLMDRVYLMQACHSTIAHVTVLTRPRLVRSAIRK
jgi:hypothetical protein